MMEVVRATPRRQSILEAVLALAAGALGFAPVLAWILVDSGSSSGTACLGFGTSCHVAPGLSPLGAIASAAVGSVLPLAMAIGGWLDGVLLRSFGSVLLRASVGAWSLIALAGFAAGGISLLPSVALGLLAILAGLMRAQWPQGSNRRLTRNGHDSHE